MNDLARNIKHLRKQEKYSQKELADLLGVSQTSVAHYEAGTRQPTIETLMMLSQLFNETIDNLVGHTRDIYDKEESPLDRTDMIEKMVNALVEKDDKLFFQLFEEVVLPQYHISTIIDVILRNVLYDIGTLWQVGKITEADEHYATNIVRKAMNYLSVKNIDTIKDRMAITFSVSSELHTLGIEMVNTYLETLGVKAMYLGSNLPIRSLDKVINEYKPRYIFISITLNDHINNLVHIVDYINEKYPDEFLIGIGGQGLLYKHQLDHHANVQFINSMSELKDFIEN